MTQTVIVTGASGYIGGQTVLELVEAGHRVIGIDRVSPSDTIRQQCAEFYEFDFEKIVNCDLIKRYSVNAIVHCAGTSLVGPSVKHPDLYYSNNFVKTKQLLDYLVKNDLQSTRVIFSSSAAVYGEPIMTPCREEDPPAPISPYGESKLMTEMMLESYSRAYDLDYVAFRYFNACGADRQGRHGQAPGATHIMARVLESIRSDSEFVLYGDSYPTPDGTCIRDYVHVEDIARAHVMAINNALPGGVYNLGTATGVSNREIISAAEAATGQTVSVTVGQTRTGDPAVLTATAERWNRVSGWQPRYTVNDMISHAWAWYNR